MFHYQANPIGGYEIYYLCLWIGWVVRQEAAEAQVRTLNGLRNASDFIGRGKHV